RLPILSFPTRRSSDLRRSPGRSCGGPARSPARQPLALQSPDGVFRSLLLLVLVNDLGVHHIIGLGLRAGRVATGRGAVGPAALRSEEHTSELQSLAYL